MTLVCNVHVAHWTCFQMTLNHGTLFGSSAVAKRVGISLRQLYHWVDTLHVVQPQVLQHGQRRFRRFTLQDIRRISRTRELVDDGYTLQAAVEIPVCTREVPGSGSRTLSPGANGGSGTTTLNSRSAPREGSKNSTAS